MTEAAHLFVEAPNIQPDPKTACPRTADRPSAYPRDGRMISPTAFAGKRTHPLSEQQKILEQFQRLLPIEPHEMIGLWRGWGIPTGHPLDGVLENLGWFGKRFTPDLRADALLFRSGENGLISINPARLPLRLALLFHKVGRTRVARNLFRYVQRGLRAKSSVASLRTISFQGMMSAAMVYDEQPIVDHFRQIDEYRIMGAMTIKGDDRIYFFELAQVDQPPTSP